MLLGQQLIGIIDDDDGVRDSMRLWLEAMGYVVTDFASAENFLRATQPAADVLLVDYHMTGMNGAAMIRALRARGVTTPAILITANTEAVETLHGEFATILRKPAREEDLLRWITAILAA